MAYTKLSLQPSTTALATTTGVVWILSGASHVHLRIPVPNEHREAMGAKEMTEWRTEWRTRARHDHG